MNTERDIDPMNLARAWTNRPRGVYLPGENGSHKPVVESDGVGFEPAISKRPPVLHQVPEHCQ